MASKPSCIFIDVKTSHAVSELFDVSQDLGLIMDLVPEWQKTEAEQAKDRIIDTLLDWVDASEKEKTD